MLKIERIQTGVIQENCYLVYNETSLLIIDPGAEPEKIASLIQKNWQKTDCDFINSYSL